MGRIFTGSRYATVVSTIALVIAVGGGTAYAAGLITSADIKDGAVRRVDIHRGAINSAKVADGSLLKGDFKAGQLPAGPQGPQGPAGPQGPQGIQGVQGIAGTPATSLWAVVASTGVISRGSHTVSSQRLATGAFEVVFDRDVTGCSYQATVGGTGGETPVGFASPARRSLIPAGVFVEVADPAGTDTNLAFHLAVFC